MEAMLGAIVKALSPYMVAGGSLYMIDRCCPPPTLLEPTDAPRARVPLGDILRRNHALRQARLLVAGLAADETRAAERIDLRDDDRGVLAPYDHALDIYLNDPFWHQRPIQPANLAHMRIQRRVPQTRVPRLA